MYITIARTISSVAGGYFREIPEVIALHLEVENFAFSVAGLGDQVLVKESLLNKQNN